MASLEIVAHGMRRLFYESRVGPMEEVASSLESPLEGAVFWALVCRFSDTRAAQGISTAGLPSAIDPSAPGVEMRAPVRWVTLWPQLDVQAGEQVYRIDLALSVVNRKTGGRAVIAVELDGHDFHERTKEQAERDRKRDRDLQSLGWRVARFTGSQAFRDVSAVVEEILAFADSVIEQPAPLAPVEN